MGRLSTSMSKRSLKPFSLSFSSCLILIRALSLGLGVLPPQVGRWPCWLLPGGPGVHCSDNYSLVLSRPAPVDTPE